MVNLNQSYYLMVKETSFGVAPTSLTNAVVFNQSPSAFHKTQQMYNRKINNIYLLTQACLSIPTINSSLVTLTGELNSGHLMLLQAYFNKAASVYSVGTSSTADSYTIIDYNPVLGKCQYVTGCSLNNLSFNGTWNQPITFTALFSGKSMSALVTTASVGFTSIPANSCDTATLFLFNSASVTMPSTLGTTNPSMSSFTINMTTLMVPLQNRFYQNTQPINNNYQNKSETINLLTLYNETNDTGIHAQQGLIQTAVTLTFNNATKHWAFASINKLADYNIKRVSDLVRTNNFTLQSAGVGSTPGYTVTVT